MAAFSLERSIAVNYRETADGRPAAQTPSGKCHVNSPGDKVKPADCLGHTRPPDFLDRNQHLLVECLNLTLLFRFEAYTVQMNSYSDCLHDHTPAVSSARQVLQCRLPGLVGAVVGVVLTLARACRGRRVGNDFKGS